MVRELKTNNMEGIGEYQDKSGIGSFALQSGNSSSLPFKEMGSSPASFGVATAAAVGGMGNLLKSKNLPSQEQAATGGEVPQHGPESHMKDKMDGKTWGGVGGTSGGQDAFEAMSMKDFKGMERGARKDYMSGLSTEDKRAQHQAFMPKHLQNPVGGMGVGGFGGMFGI